MYPLLSLPYHVRLQILDYAIDPITTAFFPSGGKQRLSRDLPLPLDPLACRTDERFRLKSLIVSLEKSTREAMQQWLAQVDFSPIAGDTNYRIGFDAVKSLTFPFFSHMTDDVWVLPSAQNRDVALMLPCENLTTIRIAWFDKDVTSRHYERGYTRYTLKTINHMHKESSLKGMLELKKLKHLDLTSIVTHEVVKALDDVGLRQVLALKQWFDDEYAKRGTNVRATISSDAEIDPYY